MNWILFGQIAGLLLLSYLLIVGAHHSIVDKRRDDALKRKQAGLLP